MQSGQPAHQIELQKSGKRSYPILIAEDHPVSRKLLEKTLVKAGHKVTSVEDGKKAFELFKKHFFPIVLTDWMMPEMDGLELCRAIRSATCSGYVFIVLLTSRDSQDDIIAGLEAGADDYLAKPFNPGELIARLKTGMRILNLERSLKKANEEILILSITDPLTGCYNRGYVDERLPFEIKTARRYRHPLSLILCDIDHFKNVNDNYGHQAGDEVLKDFVLCIKKSIRDQVDWLARYGGEEFIVVLPETDLRGAKVAAERLRVEIESHKTVADGKEIVVTVSFGVACYDPETSTKNVTSDLLINSVDKLLYQAKEQGRNRVVVGKVK